MRARELWGHFWVCVACGACRWRVNPCGGWARRDANMRSLGLPATGDVPGTPWEASLVAALNAKRMCEVYVCVWRESVRVWILTIVVLLLLRLCECVI